MQLPEKANFIQGYFSGIQIAKLIGVDKKALAEWEPSLATTSLDLVEALDRFFDEPIRLKFTIIDGIHYVSVRDHGGTERQLADVLSLARAAAETECGTKNLRQSPK